MVVHGTSLTDTYTKWRTRKEETKRGFTHRWPGCLKKPNSSPLWSTSRRDKRSFTTTSYDFPQDLWSPRSGKWLTKLGISLGTIIKNEPRTRRTLTPQSRNWHHLWSRGATNCLIVINGCRRCVTSSTLRSSITSLIG